MAGITCNGFTFYNDFDSANLAKVELVSPSETAVTIIPNGKSVIPEIPDAEFNIWTKRDCAGTEYENGNRTWFHFGFKAASVPTQVVKFNIVDLNRVGKMFSQGMAPVFKIIPGKSHWERIRDKVTHTIANGIFIVSFKYRMPENVQSTSFLAFTYPFPFSDLQKMLVNVDSKYLTAAPTSVDDIYYVRECVCTSLESRRIDLITISSYHGISAEREVRLKNLFPDENVPRPFRFIGKKVIFVSARVHPGETPSSFVMNGLLSLLLNREDPIAIILRRLYVFKIIPILNPDGVAKGHYRTDTRGVNLNRVYLNPMLSLHPPVYAARALIRYYHYGFEKEDIIIPSKSDGQDHTDGSLSDDENVENDNINEKVSHMSLDENKSSKSIWCFKCKSDIIKLENNMPGISNMIPKFNNINNTFKIGGNVCRNCGTEIEKEPAESDNIGTEAIKEGADVNLSQGDVNSNESGIFMYIDMHGHASKKGIFMYGNHFEDIDNNVDCMLLPKLMSINNHNFHFTACNFTERIMYLKDKRDGLSREGSGRVAVLKLTGLIRSYTLECNYNTGRIVNVVPPSIREGHSKMHTINVPPKYTPQVFEEVGKALGASILDLTSQNPCTRLPNSEFHTLNGLREWLRMNYRNEMSETRSVMTQTRLKHAASNYSQGKSAKGSTVQPKLQKKRVNKSRPTTVPVERKENIIYPNNQPSCSYSPNVTQRVKTGSLTSKVMKSKSKKDLLLKNKCTATEKQKTKIKQKAHLSSQKSKPDSSKLHIIKSGTAKDESDRVQLREICFLKSNIGKTLIAKYKTGDDDVADDNLVVSWEGSANNPQVFSHKTRIPPLPFLPIRATSEPGTSKQGSFRVHNFSKSSSYPKAKNKKHTLRRLASASDTLCKAEKVKKKKKLKTK